MAGFCSVLAAVLLVATLGAVAIDRMGQRVELVGEQIFLRADALSALQRSLGQRDAVDPAHRDRMFEPMQRGHDAEVQGLGIGLATCQRIAHAHGGHIGLDRSPAGGTRAWVVLPADVAA